MKKERESWDFDSIGYSRLTPAEPAPQDEAKRVISDYFARLRKLMVASLATTQISEKDEEPDHGDR